MGEFNPKDLLKSATLIDMRLQKEAIAKKNASIEAMKPKSNIVIEEKEEVQVEKKQRKNKAS